MSDQPVIIPEARQPAEIKKGSIPDAGQYRASNKEAANSLPPAPGAIDRSKAGIPSDADVKAAQHRRSPAEQIKKQPAEPVGAETVLEEQPEQKEEPKIETVLEDKNNAAEKAKNEIVAEDDLGLEGIDNEEDRELLEQLGYTKKKEEKPKLDDKGKPIVEQKAEPAIKDTKAIEAEIEQKYIPVTASAREYELVKADPILKAMIDFRKAGKSDVLEFAKEIGFVNVEAMTDEQVLNHEYTSAGLTPEEATVEKDAFDAMTPLQKKKHIGAVKNELLQARNEKLKTYTAGNEETQKLSAAAQQRALAELKETLPKMEGKKYKSLLITPEMANRIDQFVKQSPVPILNDKGQVVDYDIKKSVQRAVSELFFDDAIKSAIELGRTLGADKALDARRRVDKKIPTPAAIATGKESEKEFFEKSGDAIWKKRGYNQTKK